MDLHRLSIADLSKKIKARSISPVEVVEAFLARIDALDPLINSFITVTAEAARCQARAAEQEIAQGKWRGPLHGIPFALKDIYDTKGILTSAHSRAFIDRVPVENATVVDKLYAAGAILVGKLATFEFAVGGPTAGLPWPLARNPWNTACSPGGSSSGSAAAVAAGFVPGALGTDTGGSIRGPASWCGVSGLVPTYGLVSRAGVLPISFTFDHCGPIASTAEDCAILLGAMAGYDPKDSASVELSPRDYRSALTARLDGVKIGVLRHYWEEDKETSDEVRAAMENALSVFRSLGAKVTDARIRPLNHLPHVKWIIAQTELFSIHRRALQERPGDFGQDFLLRVLPACLVSGAEYFQAIREFGGAVAEMASMAKEYDVFVTVALGAAPRFDEHNHLDFLRKPGRFMQANVPAGPAGVFCNGFSSGGLPFGMEVIGRPFQDDTVLRVGHAYQQATDWHMRTPDLAKAAWSPIIDPAPFAMNSQNVDGALRALCDAAAARANLRLNESQRALLYAGAPFVLDMVAQLRGDTGFDRGPATTFRLPMGASDSSD